ncbi:MAG: CDF family Co(II)/Ni(II) efflux transporter DmeF [Caldimicrobium sp.]
MREPINRGKLCKEEHIFYIQKKKAESRVLLVLIITILTMIVELIAGYFFNSVALLADGIHMGSHVFAYVIAFLAYYLARKLSSDLSFTFGTWKIEVLGAYTNGLLVITLSLFVLWESLQKLFKPVETKYEEAIIVALLGLIVNLVSAYILHVKEEESQSESQSHHHDLNLKGVMVHILADVFTSVLALLALLSGKFLSLWYMDPIIGLVGFLVILKWGINLIKETIPILLDKVEKVPFYKDLISALEKDGNTKVNDLHLFRIYPEKYACIMGLTTTEDKEVEYYETILSNFKEIAHATIELKKCPKK